MEARRWLMIATVVCLALASTTSEAAKEARGVRFASGRSALSIPFDAANRQILLRARVNARSPAWLVLDTGASGSVLDEKLAAAIGLEAVGRQLSHGAGGAQEGSTVHGVDVELQGFQLLGQTMDTLSLEGLSAQAGRALDGIIGHPVFFDCVVEVDYARRLLSLHGAADYEYRGKGSIVPIDLIGHHPYVSARLVLAGGRSLEGRFVIDTGSSAGVILSPESGERERIMASSGRTLSVLGYGVGGSSEIRMARIERLELGGFSLAQPIAAIQSSGAGRVSAPRTLGNIGGAILSRFKVIFDYRRRRMILEPGPGLAEPFEMDMSGLALSAPPPDFRRVSVARVVEGSAALEAGVRAGDEIETVDGTPAAEIGVPALRERLRREGQEIKLGLRRGAERITLTLKTRRMI